MIYVVKMNEWECGLYGSEGNLLAFVSFCDKYTGVQVICGVGYSPENVVNGHLLRNWCISSDLRNVRLIKFSGEHVPAPP